MADLNALQKMFVYVPSGKVESFISNNISTDEKTIDSSNNYYNKIAFLGTDGRIATHGELFGSAADLVARIKAIEDLIGYTADNNETIDKLKEVLDWFAGIKETDTGVVLIEDVAANKEAIGTPSEGQKGEEDYKKATGIYKSIEEIWEAIGTPSEGQEDDENYKPATGLYLIIENAISNAQKSITIADDSEPYLSADDHEIGVNIVRLGDAVGLTFDEENNKWVANEDSEIEKDGLASAADVATELINDELVIANALNTIVGMISWEDYE